MADNVEAASGSGGATFATDGVGTTPVVHYPYVKLVDGAADSTAKIGGDATNGLDVDVTRVQGTVTVSGTVTANLAAGSNNIGDVDVASLPATPAGSNEIGRVRITDGTELASVDSSNRLEVAVGNTPTVTANAGTGTFTVSGTVNIGTFPDNEPINVAQWAGSAPSASNAVHVQPGTSAVFQVQSNSANLATQTTLATLALDATLTGGTAKAIARGAAKGGTSAADATVSSVDADHNAVDVYVRGGGAGDGAILDGVSSSIKATVLDYTNSNPLAVRLTDTSGDYVGAGGGTQYAEDTAATAAEQVTMAGVVRKDTAATLVDTDGDRTELQVDSSGRLHCNVGNTVTVSGSVNIGTFPDNEPFNVAQYGGTAVGASNAVHVQPGTSAVFQVQSNSANIATQTTLNSIDTHITTCNTGAVVLAAGSAKYGVVDLDSDASPGSAVPATAQYVAGTDGTNARGLKTDTSGELQVDVLTLPSNASVNVAQYNGSTVGATNAVHVQSGTGATFAVTQATASSLNAQVVGNVAHGSGISGNPVRVAGRAVTANVTAEAADDVVDMVCDKYGRMITVPYAPPDQWVSGTNASAMTDTTSTSIIGVPGASTYLYITSVCVINSDTDTNTIVNLQDGSGGTVIFRCIAAYGGGGTAISFPVPLKVPTANNALYAACVSSGANVYVSAIGYKGP